MVCDSNPDAQNLIQKALEENKFNLDRNSWWYLHGKLEDLCHYDKAVVLNLSEFPEYQGDTLKWTSITGDIAEVSKFEKKKEMKINDIIPVQVIGIDKPCIGYFWTTDERTVTAKCKNGKTKEAFLIAVEKCGQLLAENFPPHQENPNELTDGLVILEDEEWY